MPKLTTKTMSPTVKTAVIAWSAGIVIALAVAGALTYAVPGQIYGNININDKIPGYNLPDGYTVSTGKEVSLEVHASDSKAGSGAAEEHIESINWAITPLNGISSSGVSKAEGNKKCSVVRKATECTTTNTTKCTKDKKGNVNCIVKVKIGGKKTTCSKVTKNNYPSYCDLEDKVTFSEPGTYKFEGFITTVNDLSGKKATEGNKYIVDSYDIKVTGDSIGDGSNDTGSTGGISSTSTSTSTSIKISKPTVKVNENFDITVTDNSGKMGLIYWSLMSSFSPGLKSSRAYYYCKSGQVPCTVTDTLSIPKTGVFIYCAQGAIKYPNFVYGDCANVEVK